MQSMPYALLRDLVAFRFQIQDSDLAAEVQDKLEAGVAVALGADEEGRRAAHLIGHLAGFELPGSPFLAPEQGDARALRDEALACLTDYYLGMAAQSPVLVLLEDLQWADESSLDILNHLALTLTQRPVMVIMAGRPELYERRPRWGEGQSFHARLELGPLSKWDSRRLVAEILQKVTDVPQALRDLIVTGAEGNPFFIEELIKMLVEDGVIVKGDELWSLESTRLADVRVPPTLTGVLQARLDRLPLEERTVLQQASVVGRLFWDRAVARINAAEGEEAEEAEVTDRLSALRDREMVFQRETSAFADAQEYIFKHTLLREITYESVLKRVRRAYHGLVADWLLEQGGERAEEYTGLIADHLELAGRTEEAVDYLLEAGDRARRLYAHREAISAYERALALVKERGDDERAARTLMKLGLAHETAFDARQAHQAYEEGFALWQRASEAEPAMALPSAPHALRGSWTNVPTLDPGLANDATSGTVIGQLFSGLVEHTPDMGIVPGVAARWEVLEGGTRYVFHLRDDVRWSDGLPVTAHDFEYAWKRILDPATGSNFAPVLFDIRGARAYHEGLVPEPETVGVRAQDDRTLVVELEAPAGYFLQLVAYGMPVPRHAAERWGTAWTDPGKMVCNGPFALADWRPGEKLVLERNPLYYGRWAGNLERVELTLVPAGEWLPALEDYEADRADWFIFSVTSPEEMDLVRERHKREYVSFPSASTGYLAFDVTCPPFADRRVRWALALATDRQALVEAALGGYRSPATGGFVPPGMPGHVPGIALPHDPERAAELLASAGYPGGQGFPEVELLANLHFQSLCEHLQAQWREHLGVEVGWRVMDWSDLLGRLDRGPAPPMFLMGWMGDYPDPDSFLRVAVQLHAAWGPEPYLDLVGRAQRSTDQAERMKLYARAERLLAEDAPLLPLVYDRDHILLKPWVRNYTHWGMDHFWKDVVIEPH
jgi:ABC-type oligopeptide transport system substrate-binding subunit